MQLVCTQRPNISNGTGNCMKGKNVDFDITRELGIFVAVVTKVAAGGIFS
jgi:hypothetical protein